MMIYHITLIPDWESVRGGNEYTAASLGTEGFIHCSEREQVERSLNRFYHDQPMVLLLGIDPGMLTSELKYEAAHGEMFPHIYGPINIDAVRTVETMLREAGGYRYSV